MTDIMRQLHVLNPQIGADLEAEIRALTRQRTFGLVFERHQPEAVELPGLKPKRASKVRILQPRGSIKKGDNRIWLVENVDNEDNVGTAHLIELYSQEPEKIDVATDDLVVVAEFKDGIYPGLLETGRVERGADKPFHTVINAENFHALEMLTYTHRGKVDAIYIDPPYNTGAKDWKYNNDYVGSDDAYRHSKWLAMMERRLIIARELLNPEDSVLICTIDEKEYLRLGLLLEQVFPEARIQMITVMTNKKGSTRVGSFSRRDEYIFILFFGSSFITASDDDMITPQGRQSVRKTIWNSLLRRGADGSSRAESPNLFFPFYVSIESGKIMRVGESLHLGVDRNTVKAPDGMRLAWPIRSDGSEGRWQVSATTAAAMLQEGTIKSGRYNPERKCYAINYLKRGQLNDLASGKLVRVGTDEVGAGIFEYQDKIRTNAQPGTIWVRESHDASIYGSTLLRGVIPGRRFPFPKSLYAVEDTLRFFVKTKPNAIVLDFFAGSGTTAHAVMRLNKQDGGQRQCICVTNNEVSDDEQRKLRKTGLRPGDRDWEKWGICDYITKPRISAAITGRTPDGEPIKGDYKFTDEFSMSDGLEENAVFFTLTYESPLTVRHKRAFERVAPMLWMRAGSQGRIITSLGERGWDISDVYGVLENFNESAMFFSALEQKTGVRMVFLVTDDDAVFQMACRKLPEGTVPVRLYSSYLQNFEINRGRS